MSHGAGVTDNTTGSNNNEVQAMKTDTFTAVETDAFYL